MNLKKLKKIIQSIRDSNVSLQERLFRLLTLIGLISIAFAVLMGVAAGEGLVNTIGMALGFLILFVIVYFSIKYRRIQTGAVIIGGLLVYTCRCVCGASCGKQSKIFHDRHRAFGVPGHLFLVILISVHPCHAHDSDGVSGFGGVHGGGGGSDLWYASVSERGISFRKQDGTAAEKGN